MEDRVEVMNDIVAPVDSVSDNFLDSLSLNPGLTMGAVDIAMGPEEGEVHASLIHTDPHFLRRLADEAWDVGTAEDAATDSVLQDHFDGAPYFGVDRVVVTGPVGAPLLRAEEEGASEDEGAQRLIITCFQALVAGHLLRRTISIMELTMLDLFA